MTSHRVWVPHGGSRRTRMLPGCRSECTMLSTSSICAVMKNYDSSLTMAYVQHCFHSTKLTVQTHFCDDDRPIRVVDNQKARAWSMAPEPSCARALLCGAPGPCSTYRVTWAPSSKVSTSTCRARQACDHSSLSGARVHLRSCWMVMWTDTIFDRIRREEHVN